MRMVITFMESIPETGTPGLAETSAALVASERLRAFIGMLRRG
jgi:hypothetical protein